MKSGGIFGAYAFRKDDAKKYLYVKINPPSTPDIRKGRNPKEDYYMSRENNVSVSEKRNLTVKEAVAYFGVDETEILDLIKEHSELVIWRESTNILVRRIEMERHFDAFKKACEVRVSEKVNLTIKEAAAYFGLGENMIRNLAKEHRDLALWVGSGKILIKRRKMEKYLDGATSI